MNLPEDILEKIHEDYSDPEQIELIRYDINGTTNYNQEVEERHGLDGMDAIARLAARSLTWERSSKGHLGLVHEARRLSVS